MQATKADFPNIKRCKGCGSIVLAYNFKEVMIRARGNTTTFAPAGDVTVTCECTHINVISIDAIIRRGKQLQPLAI